MRYQHQNQKVIKFAIISMLPFVTACWTAWSLLVIACSLVVLISFILPFRCTPRQSLIAKGDMFTGYFGTKAMQAATTATTTKNNNRGTNENNKNENQNKNNNSSSSSSNNSICGHTGNHHNRNNRNTDTNNNKNKGKTPAAMTKNYGSYSNYSKLQKRRLPTQS